MNDVTLETDRLILRPFVEEDFAAVHAYGGNLANVKYMTFGPNSEEETRSFISRTIKAAEANPRTHYDFAISLRETGRLIGGCGIYLDAELDQGFMGWILHMDFWKQGYGTELAAALLKFGFEELKLHRIRATCNSENYGSFRVMERNGMRREAHFKQARFGRVCDAEVWYDEYHYAILADEWREGKNHS